MLANTRLQQQTRRICLYLEDFGDFAVQIEGQACHVPRSNSGAVENQMPAVDVGIFVFPSQHLRHSNATLHLVLWSEVRILQVDGTSKEMQIQTNIRLFSYCY